MSRKTSHIFTISGQKSAIIVIRKGAETGVLQGIFALLTAAALAAGAARGRLDSVVNAMLSGAQEGVTAALTMAGGFAFFCGWIGVLRRAGAVTILARGARRPLRRLLGAGLTEDALEPVAVNLAANALGLGNAATPFGMEAARRMASGDAAGNALCMFLVINSSSVQLLPATVIALRAAAGSADPGGIALPALIATALSTLVGIVSCKIAERLS